MLYETIQDHDFVGGWRVEAIDYQNEGVCYIAIFTGPEAESRAREYADWKNQSFHAAAGY